jgi:hypothetical protein
MLQKEYMLSHKRACDLRAMAQIPGRVVKYLVMSPHPTQELAYALL